MSEERPDATLPDGEQRALADQLPDGVDWDQDQDDLLFSHEAVMAREAHYRAMMQAIRKPFEDLLRTAMGRVLIVVALFVLALAVRLGALYSTQHIIFSFYRKPWIDAAHSPYMAADAADYHKRAVEFAETGELGTPFFPPGMTFLVGAVVAVFGDSFQPAKLLMVLLSALTVPLVVLLGWRVVSWPVGVFAGLLTAMHTSQIAAGITINPEPVYGLLLTGLMLGLVVFTDAADTQRFGWIALVGIGFVLGVIVSMGQLLRSEFALLLLPMAIWFWLQRSLSLREKLLVTAVVVLCFSGTVGAWTWRNYQFLDANPLTDRIGLSRIVPTTLNGPVNFFIGNNPEATGGFSRHGMRSEGSLDPTDRHHAMILRDGYGLGWQFIIDRPERWRELLVQKAWRFWRVLLMGYGRGNWPAGPEGVIEIGEPILVWSPRVLGAHAVLLVSGLGVALYRRRRRVPLLVSVLVMQTLIMMTFFGITRAALPFWPMMAILMGSILEAPGVRLFVERKARLLAWSGIILAIGLIVLDYGVYGRMLALRHLPIMGTGEAKRVEIFRPSEL